MINKSNNDESESYIKRSDFYCSSHNENEYDSDLMVPKHSEVVYVSEIRE